MVFELSNVSLDLHGNHVLQDLSLSIKPGERVVLLGVNGCGKTTLLKLLDGLVFASSGSVRYDGQVVDAKSLSQNDFRKKFRSQVALLFQNVDAMLFNPSVADEIAFGPRQLGLTDVEDRVAHWANEFRVSALLKRPPFELSGGEKKRVALAAIFALEPSVLLLDEATASLDPASAGQLVDYLAGLSKATVIASTHHLSLAEELGSRAILLAPNQKGILFDGYPADLLANEQLLIASGLAHRHIHSHRQAPHAHFHLHDLE